MSESQAEFDKLTAENREIVESMRDNLKRVRVSGCMRSVDALDNFAEQAAVTAHKEDSSFHEVTGIAMRWAAEEIRSLKSHLDEIKRAVNGRN